MKVQSVSNYKICSSVSFACYGKLGILFLLLESFYKHNLQGDTRYKHFISPSSVPGSLRDLKTPHLNTKHGKQRYHFDTESRDQTLNRYRNGKLVCGYVVAISAFLFLLFLSLLK